MAYQSFEDLDVCKRSSSLAVEIYRAIRDCREFSLKDQMTRSAISTPLNIAEGTERFSDGEFARFLYCQRFYSRTKNTAIYC